MHSARNRFLDEKYETVGVTEEERPLSTGRKTMMSDSKALNSARLSQNSKTAKTDRLDLTTKEPENVKKYLKIIKQRLGIQEADEFSDIVSDALGLISKANEYTAHRYK